MIHIRSSRVLSNAVCDVYTRSSWVWTVRLVSDGRGLANRQRVLLEQEFSFVVFGLSPVVFAAPLPVVVRDDGNAAPIERHLWMPGLRSHAGG